MSTSPSSVLFAGVCVFALSASSARASAPADNWQPYGAASQPAVAAPAPAEPPAEPAAPTPPTAAAPASDKEPPSDLLVHAAQYGGACVSGCLVSQILGMVLGPCACIAPLVRPAVSGFVVYFVGDQLGNRKSSMVAPIVASYIGDFCITGLCSTGCVGIGLVAYLAGAAAFVAAILGSSGSGLGLGAGAGIAAYVFGGVVMVVSVLGGQIVAALLSPIVPTAAYHFLNEGEGPAASSQPAPAASEQHAVTPRTAPLQSPALQTVAY
jgi:hypothetical protein